MKTLRDHSDLYSALEELEDLWTSEEVLSELSKHIGADRLRRFMEDVIHEWDLHDRFRDYEEFAEEEEY